MSKISVKRKPGIKDFFIERKGLENINAVSGALALFLSGKTHRIPAGAPKSLLERALKNGN